MTTVDELLAPMSLRQFRAAHHGRSPVHIPAGPDDSRRSLLDWAAFNRILNQTGIWTEQNLRLMLDGTAIAPHDYCDPAGTSHGVGLRVSAPKVDAWLREGASLVANEVQTLHDPIARTVAALSRTFAAQVAANVYCSFSGVRAFGSHYDNHDVFAIQTEGEKVWRIYESQLEMPVDLPPDTPETRRWLESARGRVVQELRMRPGDVLYLPRGRFHDALAVDGPSLHVTLSVTSLYGRILFPLLENAAIQMPLFREYFPPGWEDGGGPLASHLSRLGDLMRDLIASPAFLDEVTMSQQRLVPRPASFDLPVRKPSSVYRVTGQPFPAAGTAPGLAYEWCAAQERFSLEKMIAAFDFIDEADVRAAVSRAVEAGALSPEAGG